MGLGRGERGAAAKPRSDTSNSRESNVIIIRRPVISTLAKEGRMMGLRRARDSHIFNEQLLKEKLITCSSDWTDIFALECSLRSNVEVNNFYTPTTVLI